MHRLNHRIFIATLTIFFFTWGCSVEQQHKTLTFFFDGVNNVPFFNDYLSKDSLSKDAIAKREDVLKRNRPDLYVHQPFKEKKCEACHTPDKHLRMATPGLCYTCHENLAEKVKYVHGPIASGNCLNCHNEHNARYPKLLIRPGQQLCLYCHNTSLVFRTKYHRDIEDAECTLCHNPHGGNERYLIKESVAGRINNVLMTAVAERHLTGQLFTESPGDYTYRTELDVVNDAGELVSTTATDLTGKFSLTNLHPNENYTLKFKASTPAVKINIVNNKDEVVYVIEKNRKGKYSFDKNAYESSHTKVEYAQQSTPSQQKNETHTVSVKNQPENIPDSNTKQNNPTATNASKPQPISSQNAETIANKTITDTTLPATTIKETKVTVNPINDKVIEAPQPTAVETKETANTRKGKIVVITDDETKAIEANSPVKSSAEKSKSDSTSTIQQPIKKSPTYGSEFATKSAAKKSKVSARQDISMEKLAQQLSAFYPGTTVCMLDTLNGLMGIGTVDNGGYFLINDFLPYYHVNLADRRNEEKTIFINDKMEVLKIVRKSYENGHIVFRRQPISKQISIEEITANNNPAFYLPIYFDNSNLTKTSKKQLKRLASFLDHNAQSKIYLRTNVNTSQNNNQVVLRIKLITDYLIDQGTAKSRIISNNEGKPESTSIPKEKNSDDKRIDILIRPNDD